LKQVHLLRAQPVPQQELRWALPQLEQPLEQPEGQLAQLLELVLQQQELERQEPRLPEQLQEQRHPSQNQ
jgi:cell shape-determining protein MreC